MSEITKWINYTLKKKEVRHFPKVSTGCPLAQVEDIVIIFYALGRFFYVQVYYLSHFLLLCGFHYQ